MGNGQEKGKMRSIARPVTVIAIAVTLCILAVFESTGEAVCPVWFKVFGIPFVVEYFSERIYRKSKGEK